MKLSDILKESTAFDDFDILKFDADRDDIGDVVDKIIPLLIKLSYKVLLVDKESHEKKFGAKSDEEDAYNFEFTKKALVEETNNMIRHLSTALVEYSDSDIETDIKAIKFKEKLDD